MKRTTAPFISWLALACLSLPRPLPADGPADNLPDAVRPVPRPGIIVPLDKRLELEAGLAALRGAMRDLARTADPRVAPLLPDVAIYAKAIGDALAHSEFFKAEEVDRAKVLLEEGRERAAQLAAGEAPWTTRRGLVVRGYVSRIDGSVQPYGLVVPESYSATGAGRFRLDLWFHGRDEVLSEVNFLDQRRRSVGTFAPPDAIVLHPYGRFCNAFKLAGEIDVLEAMDSVRERYRIDDDRITVRGFSMGGAAAWHLAVHYADRWAAANPGAGFAETAEFLKVFQRENVAPPGWERKLWHLYDATDSALNLFHCPTVAYSGELDGQKQAADVMERALRADGIELRHVIGPGTKHQYHPRSRDEVEALVTAIARRGREQTPRRIRFVTYTLRYPRMHWVTVEGLGEHWKRARVEADVTGESSLTARTENVTALAFSMPAGACPFELTRPVRVEIDGQAVELPKPLSDRSWSASLHRGGGEWKAGRLPGDGLRKAHGLQGPIDDAFLDRFLFVRPSGASEHPRVDQWTWSELGRATTRWRRQFRGDPPLKDDGYVNDEDIASANLVLWGDPSSNSVLRRIADRLPVRWEGEWVVAGDRRFPAGTHVPALIYPNPLNPRRYVVLNSGVTFREYDDLNNARQVPKLPDWSVLDLTDPPNSRRPGKIAAAGFFGESWELKPAEE